MKKEIVEAATESKTLRKPAPISSSKIDNEKKVSEKKRNSDAGGGKISSGATDPSGTRSPSKSPTVVIPLTKVNVPKAFSDVRAATNASKAGSSKSQEMKKEISSPDSNSSATTPTTRPRRSITLKNKTDENNTTK